MPFLYLAHRFKKWQTKKILACHSGKRWKKLISDPGLNDRKLLSRLHCWACIQVFTVKWNKVVLIYLCHWSVGLNSTINVFIMKFHLSICNYCHNILKSLKEQYVEFRTFVHMVHHMEVAEPAANCAERAYSVYLWGCLSWRVTRGGTKQLIPWYIAILCSTCLICQHTLYKENIRITLM